MANPKRRHSRARRNQRRSHDALRSRNLSECPECHEKKPPHQACPHCGKYRGRQVVEVSES